MNIAISFSGEGLGHLTRMTALAKQLESQHTIIFYCPETVRPHIRSLFPQCKSFKIPLMALQKNGLKVNYISTSLKSIPTILSMPFVGLKLKKHLKKHKIEAVICDYEPFLTWGAKLAGIPIIAFNHQAMIDRHFHITISSVIAKFVNRLMIPFANKTIASSFYNGDVGPLLREEIVNTKATVGEHILVYLKPEAREIFTPIMDENPSINFITFPNPDANFISSLASAKAVICPAGHQLLSEALFFKKPIFTIPEQCQFEQELNAEMLENSGWGINANKKNVREKFTHFINTLDEYPHPPKNIKKMKFSDDSKKAARLVKQLLLGFKNP